MSSRVSFFFVFIILAFATAALTAGVKVYERRINDEEFLYNNGSAKIRFHARPARTLHVPEE